MFLLLFDRFHFVLALPLRARMNRIPFCSCTCNAFWGVPSIPSASNYWSCSLSSFFSEVKRCGSACLIMWLILKHGNKETAQKYEKTKRNRNFRSDWKDNFFGWNTTKMRILCTPCPFSNISSMVDLSVSSSTKIIPRWTWCLVTEKLKL